MRYTYIFVLRTNSGMYFSGSMYNGFSSLERCSDIIDEEPHLSLSTLVAHGGRWYYTANTLLELLHAMLILYKIGYRFTIYMYKYKSDERIGTPDFDKNSTAYFAIDLT